MLDEKRKPELFLELSNKQQQFVRGGDSPFVIIYDLGGYLGNPAASGATGTPETKTPATAKPHPAIPTLNLPAIPAVSLPLIPAVGVMK